MDAMDLLNTGSTGANNLLTLAGNGVALASNIVGLVFAFI